MRVLSTALLGIALVAILYCKKEETQPVTPQATPRAESFAATVQDVGYTGSFTVEQFDSDQQYLNLAADCGNGVTAQYGSGCLSAGTYSNDENTTDRGFVLVADTNAFYCTDGTVAMVTHDNAARYFKCRITGTLSLLGGGAFRTLNEARSSSLY